MTGPAPDYKDLLRRVSIAANRGAKPEDLDAYIRRESQGGLQNITALAEAASAKPPTPGWGGAYAKAGGLLAQGATLGFSDELAGLGAAIVPGGQGYTEARDAVRAKLAETRQQAPLLSAGLEMAGGVLPALAAGPLGLAGGGPMALAQRVGQGVGAGGVFGTIAGAGYSEGQTPGDVAKDALGGGGVGAALGVALPVLGAVAKKVGTGASHLVQMLKSPDAAAKRVGYTRAIKAFQNLGMTPEEALAETRKLAGQGGASVVVADLDPNLAAEARRSLTNAPGVNVRILDQMETRGAGRGERMASEAERAMGITRDQIDVKKGNAIRSLRELGKKLYDPFKDQPITPEHEMRIEEFLRDPVLDQMDPNIAKVLRGMYQETPQMPDLPWPPPPGLKKPELAKMGYDLSSGIPKRPEPSIPHSFEKLQEIRHRLVGLKNQAATGGDTWSAEQYANKAQELTGLMEDIFPGYHTANATWRRAAVRTPTVATGRERDFVTKAGVKVQDAWLEGMDALGKTGPEVQKRMSDLLEIGGPEAADAFRNGWLEALTTELRSKTKTGNLGEALVSMGDDLADVHKIMFPRPEDYNRMMGRARAERAMRRTETAIGGARSTIDRGDPYREAQLGAEAAGGMLTRSWWAAVRAARLGLREATGNIEGQANKHLLKFLTSPPSPENQAMWDELQRMFQMQGQLPAGPTTGPALSGQMAGRVVGQTQVPQ